MKKGMIGTAGNQIAGRQMGSTRGIYFLIFYVTFFFLSLTLFSSSLHAQRGFHEVILGGYDLYISKGSIANREILGDLCLSSM